MPAAHKPERTGAMSWWRCYHGAPTDQKWALVAKRLSTGGAIVRAGEVWAVASCVYDAASKGKPRGNISKIDLEEVSFALGFEHDLVVRIFDGLRDKDVHDGAQVCAWVERQPAREDPTAAERKAKQRAKNKGARTLGAQGAQPEGGPGSHGMSRGVTRGHDASRPEERRGEDSRVEKNLLPPEKTAARDALAAWPDFGGRKGKKVLREVFDRLVATHPPTVGGSIADAWTECQRLAVAGELPPPRTLLACNIEYAIELRDLHAQQEKDRQTKQKVVGLENWFRGKRWESVQKKAEARIAIEQAQSDMIDMLRGALGLVTDDLVGMFGGAPALVATLAEADIALGPPVVVQFHRQFTLDHIERKYGAQKLAEISGDAILWTVRAGATVHPIHKPAP